MIIVDLNSIGCGRPDGRGDYSGDFYVALILLTQFRELRSDAAISISEYGAAWRKQCAQSWPWDVFQIWSGKVLISDGGNFMPQLTVITPVFNGIRYISECIENVLSQGVPDVEHLVIDGGSTDGTPERLAELAASYPHLRYVSEKDFGQSDAMNKGIRMAAGDVIGFLNVDDYYSPGALAEALAFLNHNSKVDFVAGDCRVINETGALISINIPSDLRLETLLLGWEYGQFPANPSAYFYKKNVHSVVGEYDVSEHYTMDFAFLLACAAKVRMAYVSRLWGNFRLMPGTKTFEDARLGRSSGRIRRLRLLWIDQLSPSQHIRMRIIKIQKRGWRAAKLYFAAIGRRLRRLMPLQPSDRD